MPTRWFSCDYEEPKTSLLEESNEATVLATTVFPQYPKRSYPGAGPAYSYRANK